MSKLPKQTWIDSNLLRVLLMLTTGLTLLLAMTSAQHGLYAMSVFLVLGIMVTRSATGARVEQVEHRYRVRILLCLLPALVSVLLMVIYATHQFADFAALQYDDSYITYRYAANLVNGDGLRFNPGDNSNSASSLLFVLLLSFGELMTPFELPRIATSLNLMGLFLLVLFPGFLVARRLGIARANVLMLSVGICLGVFPPLVYWTFSGMETTFFIGLLSTAVCLSFLTQEDDLASIRTWSVAYPVVLALLSITRIEGAVAATVIGIAGQLYQLGPFKIRKPRNLRVCAVPAIAPAVFGLQLLFNALYYDSPISDPVRFKEIVNYYNRSASAALDTLSTFLFDIWRLPSLVVCAATPLMLYAMRKSRSRLFWFVTLDAITFAVLILFILRSPHSDERRYELVLLVPVFLGLVGIGTWMIAESDRRSDKRLSHLVLFALSGLFATTAVMSQRETKAIHTRVDAYMYVQQARQDAAKWLNAHSKADSVVMSSDIGALSYFNLSNVFLDTAGLVNRTQLTAVLDRRDVYETMRQRKPEYLVDTVTLEGVSGVEQILSSPLSYYTPETGAFSSCTSPPLFKKTVLKRFPDNPPAGLQIEISRIEWDNCGQD